jgi:hypothetical protein
MNTLSLNYHWLKQIPGDIYHLLHFIAKENTFLISPLFHKKKMHNSLEIDLENENICAFFQLLINRRQLL